MRARKRQTSGWLIAGVACLAMLATGCRHTTTTSQAPSASTGNSGSAALATGSPSASAGASWVRPIDLPRHLALGDHFGCAVVEPGTADRVPGTVLCWGETSLWLNPVRPPHDIAAPTQLPGLTDVVELQGSRSMCGRTTLGEIWCWGAQPGTWDPARATPMGPFTFSGPRRVDGISHAVALAVTGTTACAVTNEGTVLCWGDNPQGTVGNGTNQKQPEPVALRLDFRAVGVTLDEQNGCAWGAEGQIACWGRVQGNARKPYREPTNVPAIAQLAQLDLPGRCALLRDHSARCWQGAVLADSDQPAPWQLVAIPNLADATALTTTRDYGCALRSTGQLRCWANSLGRAIPGEVRSHSQLTAHDLTQASNIAEAAAGEGQLCVRRRDASLACWGDDSAGSEAQPQGLPVQTSCVDSWDCRYDAEPSLCRSRAPGEPAAAAYANPGPSCECTSGRCSLIQIPRVPCKTNQDCWISDELPHRPIERPVELRGRKFKPCVDGEVAPLCRGVCGYDPRVWKC